MFRFILKPVRSWAGAVFLTSVFLVSVRAEEGPQPPYELTPNLVVTPARAGQAIDTVLDAVSVLTREDIERSVAQDLPDLLRLLPGIDVVRTGPAGSQTSVFMRGANSNHVLVLIDGVRASSTNTGAYAWEQLPVNQIERIEIVRGPKGSVYGSEAIGGVIQVFTRSRPDPYLRATGGTWRTREIAGGWGAEAEGTRFSINGGYRKTEGFSAQNPGGFGFHPDDDGLESASLGLHLAHRLGSGLLRFSVLFTDNETEFDQGVSDMRQSVASLRYEQAFSPAWSHQLVAGYVNDRLDSDFGAFATGFRSKRAQLAWQHEVVAGAGTAFRFGLDHTADSGENEFAFDEDRDNTGVYAGVEHAWSRWLLQTSARVDDNSEFGAEFTGQFSLGFDVSERWRLAAAYGSGFRGPNLNEQFSPGFGGLFAGNPGLRPESSRTAELSLRQAGAAGRFQVSVYRTSVDDLITFAGPGFQAINIEQARLKGLEFEYALERGAWRLGANATLQRAEDHSTGKPLLRRPEEKAAVVIDRAFAGSGWVGLEWFVSGRRADIGGISLPSYRLLNLRAGWPIFPDWRLELRADNLFDEDYEPALGFNAAGRSAFVSLAWMP